MRTARVAATIFPMDERRLIDIAREAASDGLRLYTDGQRVIQTRHPLPGWFPIGVVIRPQRRAA